MVILFWQAFYFKLTDRWAEVVAVYDEIVALESRLGSSYFSRGEAWLHVADDEATRRAALADFDAAIAHEYGKAVVFEKRAEVHALLGDEGAAQADWERAAQLAQLPA